MEHAQALHLYLLHDGDEAAAAKAGTFPPALVRKYAKKYDWPNRLEEQRSHLIKKAAGDALLAKQLDLKMLHSTKIAAFRAISGYGTPGQPGYIKPLKFNSGRDAVESLCRAVELEREIHGPERGAEDGPGDEGNIVSWTALVRETVKAGGSVSVKGVGEKPSDEADPDDDNALGIRG